MRRSGRGRRCWTQGWQVGDRRGRWGEARLAKQEPEAVADCGHSSAANQVRWRGCGRPTVLACAASSLELGGESLERMLVESPVKEA